MPAGAKQEGTSDVAYSRNQPSVLEDDREPQRQSGARSGAPQTSNSRRIADFRRSQVCDSRIHKLARTIDDVFGPAKARCLSRLRIVLLLVRADRTSARQERIVNILSGPIQEEVEFHRGGRAQ